MKNLLIFLGGAVCGAVGALWYLRKDYEAKLEEAEVRLNAVEEQVEENIKVVEKNAEKITKTTAKLAKKARDYSKMCEKLQYKDENGPVSAVEALIREDREKDESVDQEDDLPFKGPSEGLNDVPYGISDKDFIHDGKEDFDKVTIFYYRGDDVLAEEDGTVIKDWKYNVGEDWKDQIGRFVDDEAFIRNERIGTDYNIVCEDMSYTDEFGEEE